MKETKKITSSELKQLIKEEVARAQKIKSLKEEKAKIEKLLKEMEEMDGMEEYAEIQPSDVPGHAPEAPAMDLAAMEKDLASKVKLDPAVVDKIASEPSTMEEGFMDMVKGVFGKKDAVKKEAPMVAANAGIKTAEDFKDQGKMEKFIGGIMEKLGVGSAVGGVGTYLTAAIWSAIKGSAYAATAAGLPAATIALLLGGLIVGVVGSYMKYAAAKKGAVKK